MSIEDSGSMRSVLRSFLPWFGKKPISSRILTPIGKALDKATQAAIDAVRLRYPGVCPPDALPIIGRDRRIPRAPGESSDSYRRRLILWLDYWAHAGLPLGLLYAVQSYLYPGYPTVRYVTRTGYWYTLDAGTSATMTPYEAMTLPCTPDASLRYVPELEATPRAPFWAHVASPNNWDYDSLSNPERAASWWDFWLIVHPPHYDLQGNYDDDVYYDSGTCWGFNEPQSTFDTLRTLVRTYKRAGADCRGILFAPTANDFDPYAAVGALGMPDGWWGHDVRLSAGQWIGTRREDVRYVEI